MAFNDLINKYVSLLVEQEPAATQDAAAPAPQAEQPEALPKSKEQTVTVPPEGYVDMVRLLAKALVMNVPAGSIDALFTTPITKENATAVREGLQDAINTNENYADNPQKIADPHVQHDERKENPVSRVHHIAPVQRLMNFALDDGRHLN